MDNHTITFNTFGQYRFKTVDTAFYGNQRTTTAVYSGTFITDSSTGRLNEEGNIEYTLTYTFYSDGTGTVYQETVIIGSTSDPSSSYDSFTYTGNAAQNDTIVITWEPDAEEEMTISNGMLAPHINQYGETVQLARQ